MLKYQGPTYKDLNVTVAAYLPRKQYDQLLQIAQEKTETERTGWWSMSRLVREIIIEYLEAHHGQRA